MLPFMCNASKDQKKKEKTKRGTRLMRPLFFDITLSADGRLAAFGFFTAVSLRQAPDTFFFQQAVICNKISKAYMHTDRPPPPF